MESTLNQKATARGKKFAVNVKIMRKNKRNEEGQKERTDTYT